MEKQSEKQMIEGFNGIQRDFGVRGSIEKDNGFIDREDALLQLGEVICSFPGEQTELGRVLCGLGGSDEIMGGTFEISGDAIGIEGARDIEEQWVGPGSENIDKTSGTGTV